MPGCCGVGSRRVSILLRRRGRRPRSETRRTSPLVTDLRVGRLRGVASGVVSCCEAGKKKKSCQVNTRSSNAEEYRGARAGGRTETLRLQWSFLEHQNRRVRTRRRRSLLAENRNRRRRRSTLAKTKLRHRLRSSSRLNSEKKAQTSTAAPANTMTKRVNKLAACSAMLCSRRDKENRGKESPDPTHSHRALSPARIPARRRCCCCRLPFFPLPLSRLLLRSMLLLFQSRRQGGS